MDAESSEKLVHILRSTVYLVKHYGKHVQQSASLLDLERSLLAAIADLEAAPSPGINGDRGSCPLE